MRCLALLISHDGRAQIQMPKSGVTVIECDGPVAPGRGRLRLHLGPREITRLLDGGAIR